jgi:hypothetical protein
LDLILTEATKDSNHFVVAFGTAAMRTQIPLAAIVTERCEYHGVEFNVITQEHEARLIRDAATSSAEAVGMAVINAGGKSIQVVCADGTLRLYDFGIVDLNARFELTAAPAQRRADECIRWLRGQLPDDIQSFMYTGGERTYLTRLGVPLTNGVCQKRDFVTLHSRLLALPVEELAELSPFDPAWMSGAIASNCIVLAIMATTALHEFLATDLNVAHGLMSSLLLEGSNVSH